MCIPLDIWLKVYTIGYMKQEEGLVFGPASGRRPLSEGRRIAATDYVMRALAATSPVAVKLQRKLIEEGMEDGAEYPAKALGLKAADMVLDRFLGKAAVTANVVVSERAPIVFNGKLAALNAAMEEAVDAKVRLEGEGTAEALARAVTAHMVDGEGVVI